MKKSNKKFIIAEITAAALLLGFAAFDSAASVQAAQIFKPADKQQVSVNVPNGTAVKDLYAFGKTVIVDASSTKDAVAAGSDVIINGNTADDLIAAGGTVNVNGSVGGTLRVAGGTVNVLAPVHDDLVVAGGTVYIGPNAQIGGDILVAGGNVSVNGAVAGNIIAAGGVVQINSKVGGNVNARARNFALGPQANIAGNVDYTSANAYQRDSGAQVAGQVVYHQPAQRGNAFGLAMGGLAVLALILKYAAMLIVACLLFYMYQSCFVDSVTISLAEKRFWKTFAWGLIAFIATPLVILVLFLSLIGYYAAIILLAVYILALLIAALLGTVGFGLWIMELISRHKVAVGYGSIALALLIAFILEAIPFLGWAVMIIVTLGAFGAMLTMAKRRKV